MVILEEWFYMDVITNLVSAIAGGILTAIFARSIQIIKNKRVASRYPVAGEYLSSYQDVVDGRKVNVVSRSSLYQRGYSIYGKTMLENGRSWELNGTLLEHGHIYGSYKPSQATDEGIGAFYLRLSEGDLRGMWAGYDSVNKKISSGDYEFKRIAKVEIALYSKERHRPEVFSIAHTVFGDNYFDHVAVGEHGNGKCFLVAEDKGAVRGFVVGELLEKERANDVLKSRLDMAPKYIQIYDKMGKLGILRTIAVDRRFQKRGIGCALVARAEKEMKNMGADALIVLAWKAGTRVNLASLADYLGYKSCGIIEKYWEAECDSGKFLCPERVAHPEHTGGCMCSVKVYCKAISALGKQRWP